MIDMTKDVIAWEKLPDWVEWVARDDDGTVNCFNPDPVLGSVNWYVTSLSKSRRIDDFPGIVQIGTVDWKDSKQRRPR